MYLDCEFTEIFIESRLSRAECAQFLGVNSSTLRRWLSNKHDAPKSAVEALRMLSGFTPRMSKRGKAFHGWRFRDGMLFTDEGMGFTPSQIRAIWHSEQLIKGLNHEIKALKAVVSELRENLSPALPDNVIPFPVRSGSGGRVA